MSATVDLPLLPKGHPLSAPYYQDDLVTLYHGDANEILPRLQTDVADATITDPPFFMPAQNYASRSDAWARSWSDTSILGTWWSVTAAAITRVTKPTGHVLAFCDHASYPVFYPPLYTRWPNLACLTWDKGRPGMGTAWRSSSELIIAARGEAAYWNGPATGSIFRENVVHSNDRLHPVDKPVRLLRRLMDCTVPPRGMVLDPFVGGGSTLIAARESGRRVIGVELEERYCEIAARRLSQQGFDFGDWEAEETA